MEKRGTLLPEDVGVPVAQLSTLFSGIAVVAGQAPDRHQGCRARRPPPPPVIVYDPTDSAAAESAEAFAAVMDLAISVSGTINSEHGVG